MVEAQYDSGLPGLSAMLAGIALLGAAGGDPAEDERLSLRVGQREQMRSCSVKRACFPWHACEQETHRWTSVIHASTNYYLAAKGLGNPGGLLHGETMRGIYVDLSVVASHGKQTSSIKFKLRMCGI